MNDTLSAIFSKDLSALTQQLDAGADINHSTSDNGFSLLHWAAHENACDIAETLLKRGANPDARDQDETTPLMLAACAGYLEMSKLLLGAGCEVNARNRRNQTALSIAAEFNQGKMIELLIARGANVLHEDSHGQTIAKLACLNGSKTILESALRAGFPADYRDPDGRTCLMYAARDGYSELVGILLKAGADANALTNPKGVSAFDLAKSRGHHQVLEALLAWQTQDLLSKMESDAEPEPPQPR